MVKEKRILSYFIGWLVLGYIIFVIGINDVFAAEQKNGLGFLNNSNVYISNNKGADIQLTRQTANNVNMDIKTILFISNYNFKANTVYDYEIQTTGQYLRNIDKANILSNNGICTLIGLSGLGKEYTKVRFTCSSPTSSINISLSNSNDNNITNGYNINWQSIYLWSITDTIDLGPIINNQSQNTQDILNNDNKNTQDIIDSNKETQDVIKDQFNSCRPSKNLFDAYNITFGTPHNSSYIINDSNSITVTNNGGWSRIYATINGLKPNTFYTISADMINNNNIPAGLWINDNNNNLQYNDSKVIVRTNSNGSIDFQFYTNWNSTPNYGQVIYNNIQIEEGSSATTFEKPGKICTNKLDEQNDKLQGIQGALTDSSTPNTSGLQNSAGWLPAGPLDSVLNLPLSLFNALTTNLNKTCNPINIPLPYVNKNITLPCINTLYNKIGITSFLSWIGVIVSGLMLYSYLLKLYKWIEDRISLNETHNVDSWGGL